VPSTVPSLASGAGLALFRDKWLVGAEYLRHLAQIPLAFQPQPVIAWSQRVRTADWALPREVPVAQRDPRKSEEVWMDRKAIRGTALTAV
jgi:hypothetical protein